MNARLIAKATVIEAAGNLPKVIEEFVGRVNSGTEALSIARMSSPTGWIEPGQTPEFDEYTVVLRGLLRVTTRTGVIDVAAGQAVISPRGQWVQYSTPGVEGRNISPSAYQLFLLQLCTATTRRRNKHAPIRGIILPRWAGGATAFSAREFAYRCGDAAGTIGWASSACAVSAERPRPRAFLEASPGNRADSGAGRGTAGWIAKNLPRRSRGVGNASEIALAHPPAKRRFAHRPRNTAFVFSLLTFCPPGPELRTKVNCNSSSAIRIRDEMTSIPASPGRQSIEGDFGFAQQAFVIARWNFVAE